MSDSKIVGTLYPGDRVIFGGDIGSEHAGDVIATHTTIQEDGQPRTRVTLVTTVEYYTCESVFVEKETT